MVTKLLFENGLWYFFGNFLLELATPKARYNHSKTDTLFYYWLSVKLGKLFTENSLVTSNNLAKNKLSFENCGFIPHFEIFLIVIKVV